MPAAPAWRPVRSACPLRVVGCVCLVLTRVPGCGEQTQLQGCFPPCTSREVSAPVGLFLPRRCGELTRSVQQARETEVLVPTCVCTHMRAHAHTHTHTPLPPPCPLRAAVAHGALWRGPGSFSGHTAPPTAPPLPRRHPCPSRAPGRRGPAAACPQMPGQTAAASAPRSLPAVPAVAAGQSCPRRCRSLPEGLRLPRATQRKSVTADQ